MLVTSPCNHSTTKQFNFSIFLHCQTKVSLPNDDILNRSMRELSLGIEEEEIECSCKGKCKRAWQCAKARRQMQ